MRKAKPQKITENIWARLVMHGKNHARIHAMYGPNGARLERIGDKFVMTRRDQRHELAVDFTNEARLDAHWQQFTAIA